jgi:glycosyltransferase involved in cell wall biosynthesis
MTRANADVYYQRGVGALTGFVAAFARRRGRLSVYAAAHDLDFDPDLSSIKHARDRLICRWGLRNASAIVAQSLRQRQACLRTLGRPSTLIHSVHAHRGAPADKGGPVIWVGSFAERKRPALIVELARLVPNRRFKIVGSGSDAQTTRLRALAASLENIEFTGFVPYAEVEQHFDGASVLINTSTGEGFPNTFLQAWSRGMPTLSFFDADAYRDGRAVGLSVRDIPAMAAALAELSRPDSHAWANQSALCAHYMLDNHRVDVAVGMYEDLIASLAQVSGGIRARKGRK